MTGQEVIDYIEGGKLQDKHFSISMANTITIKVEVFDGTTAEQLENIVGDALDSNGIDCTYDVEEAEG